MSDVKGLLAGIILGFLGLIPATAKSLNIEFLEGAINPATIENLSGLACRNLDHIVHLKIAVDWPAATLGQEGTGFRRLIFWNDKAEYLFPNGAYAYRHGNYVINGYFVVRSGGIHQGIVSNYFEKIDDARARRNPNVNEVKAKGPDC